MRNVTPLRVLLPFFCVACTCSAQSFFTDSIDRKAQPCGDFYQFACGGWLAANPVPPDRSSWGRFHEVDERNRERLRTILESAVDETVKRNSVDQKLGDLYFSCMNEESVGERGLAPIQPEFARIATINSKQGITAAVTRLHTIGGSPFFQFGSAIDMKDSRRRIAEIDQGGLGLPNRDYYTKTDEKSVQIRQGYVAHLIRMFELLGNPSSAAAQKAKAILDIETQLAQASLDQVGRRDPAQVYHPYKLAELISLSPGFDWVKYFESLNQPGLATMNVVYPPFIRQMESIIVQTPLEDIKAYLTWSLLRETIALLPAAFVDENFNFFGKILEGKQQIRARWKRCVDLANQQMGDALGQRFVEQTFGQQGKERTRQMVKAIEGALARDIDSLPWMTGATKQAALDKLRKISDKIGYPDKWKSYESIPIGRDTLFENTIRLSEAEYARDLSRIGKPVDRGEFGMTTPTVNAYYNAQQNDINFPAGILQPPFYDNKLDDAVNMGAIGAVIGHELTHGFDDQGRQFDLDGNLRDWWTEKDSREFEQRAACFVNQYGGQTAIDDLKINGKLTLGENSADNGGLRVAYMALLTLLAGHPRTLIDGFTPEQRFFLGWAQIWCTNQNPEFTRMLNTIDPHSPARSRVNTPLSNMPEFQKAFACTAEQPMVASRACRVW
jgi:putative endopeptidase